MCGIKYHACHKISHFATTIQTGLLKRTAELLKKRENCAPTLPFQIWFSILMVVMLVRFVHFYKLFF